MHVLARPSTSRNALGERDTVGRIEAIAVKLRIILSSDHDPSPDFDTSSL